MITFKTTIYTMLTTDYKFGEVNNLDSQVTADYENVHSKQRLGNEKAAWL